MPYKIPAHIQAMLDELRALRAELEENEAEVLRLEDRQNEIRRQQDVINGQIAAAEIPALYAEKAANEEEIAELQKRKRYYEIQLKICEKEKKEYERKQRSRRIFTRGGMLESFLREPLLMTDEQVHDFLMEVFRMPDVDTLLSKLLARCHKEYENGSEEDSENGAE
ncbi:MAG: DUF3847 domain-containing protein [Oscillospiraceae bacterium]|nr:DUF3847 domain-containing protein [Oscillospiraceae bacterium]MBR4896520.1 DUF3847 domain-containing protein [Clostridia bacterium]